MNYCFGFLRCSISSSHVEKLTWTLIITFFMLGFYRQAWIAAETNRYVEELSLSEDTNTKCRSTKENTWLFLKWTHLWLLINLSKTINVKVLMSYEPWEWKICKVRMFKGKPRSTGRLKMYSVRMRDSEIPVN